MIYFEGESEISKKDIKLLVGKISHPKQKMKESWRQEMEDKSQQQNFETIQNMEMGKLFLNAKEARNMVNSYEAKEYDSKLQFYDTTSYQILKKLQKDHKEKTTITFCGGHSLPREQYLYFEMMKVGQQLANNFAIIYQGGGSGTMEAVYLGACLKNEKEERLKEVWDEIKKGKINFEEYKTEQVISICCFALKASINDFPQQLICFYNNSLREVALMECSNNVFFVQGGHGTFFEMSYLLQQNGNPEPKGYIYNFYSFSQETIKKSIYIKSIYIKNNVEKINKDNLSSVGKSKHPLEEEFREFVDYVKEVNSNIEKINSTLQDFAKRNSSKK